MQRALLEGGTNLVGGARDGALDVRQGEDAGLAANEQGAGELGVEAQQAGARPEGHAVHHARCRSQVKHLQGHLTKCTQVIDCQSACSSALHCHMLDTI